MRTPLTKHSNQKYCEYHRDHGHWTEECLSLKKEIEMFIRQGKLKEFVAQNKDVRSYPWEKGKEKPRTTDAFIERTFTLTKKLPTRELLLSTSNRTLRSLMFVYSSRKKEEESYQQNYPLSLYTLVSKELTIKTYYEMIFH
jgi:hypothetical protein